MPKRVPVQSIVVYRPLGFPDHVKDEKRTAAYVPPVGRLFDFTAAEVEEVTRRNPAAMSTEATIDVTTEEGRQVAAALIASEEVAKKGMAGPPTTEKVAPTTTPGKSATDDV